VRANVKPNSLFTNNAVFQRGVEVLVWGIADDNEKVTVEFNGQESQLISWKKTPNTAMVVTADCGDSADIHPANKKPVGERLALAARALAYDQKVVYSGPIYSSMEVKDNTIVLTFDQVNKGLVAKGGFLTDFVISENGKEFVSAKAIIRSNKIIVSATGISKPVAVRMGWSNVPHINLFNKDGLPASPFRTDVQ
jgi:sialate O-acetylesterase